MQDKNWTVVEEKISEEKMRFRETLFTLGNGYLGSRGILEEGYKQGYAGTYLAGIYDKSESQSPEIVNLPNPVALEIYLNDTKLSKEKMKVLEHHRILDIRNGLLARNTVFGDNNKNMYRYESTRFFSLDNVHIGAIQADFSSPDCAPAVTVKGIIDGTTRNEFQAVGEPVVHYELIETGIAGKDILYMSVKTRESGIVIGFAVVLTVLESGKSLQNFSTKNYTKNGIAVFEISFNARKNVKYRINKLISIFTSHDTKNVKTACIKELKSAQTQGINVLLENHKSKWNKLWECSDIEIRGDEQAQKALRFNSYHLLISSPVAKNIDASILAKTLSGEWYKGHVFWDTEIFTLPFFIYTQPEIAKRMLMYRYRRLAQACENAKKRGYSGSLWPWESAWTGEDETPDSWVNFDGTKIPVHNKEREHHISADVIYGLAHYHKITGDENFMLRYGAEMVFETARFWASRVVYNKNTGKYEIKNVIGPNEFQECVNNNSYTNYLAGWMLKYAVEIYTKLQEKYPDKLKVITNKIKLTDEEVSRWREIGAKIVFLIDSAGLIEEFEGYFNKKDVTIKEWDDNGMPVWPKDVKLSEVKHTQLVKQADVMLLLYLLLDEFSDIIKQVNYEYYEKRTTHKSSLSIPSYAISVLQFKEIVRKDSYSCGEKAYKYFIRAVNADICNIYGNTELGIHAAALGGSWQIAINGFAGVRVKDNMLILNPTLPPKWQEMRFKIWFRKMLLEVFITKNKTNVFVIKDENKTKRKIDIEICGKKIMCSISGNKE